MKFKFSLLSFASLGCMLGAQFVFLSSDVTKIGVTVSRHFGPRTLRTQDISALSDWCRTVSTSITPIQESVDLA